VFQKWSLSKCTKGKILLGILGISYVSCTAAPLALNSQTNPKSTIKTPEMIPNPAVEPQKKPDHKVPQHIGKLTKLPPLLEEVEAKYTKASTLTAEFAQITEDAVLLKKKISSGKIFIKRPSRVRWETLLPDQNLLVSDGKHFWYYTPPFDEGERGQVIEKKSSDVQSRLANSLLSGSFSMNRDMVIRTQTPSQFLLIPKAGSAGTVIQAIVDIDPQERLIRRVTLNHRGGNRAEISLTKIELGKDLGDTLFQFKTPPNTDKLDDFSGK
jgi:outer membrane lipoprotein carrier protein